MHEAKTRFIHLDWACIRLPLLSRKVFPICLIPSQPSAATRSFSGPSLSFSLGPNVEQPYRCKPLGCWHHQFIIPYWCQFSGQFIYPQSAKYSMFPIYQQCLLCLKRTGLAAEMWNTKSPQIYIAMSLFSFSPSQLFRKCAETRRRRKRLCITKTSAMKRLENSQFNSNFFTIFVLQATSTHQNPVYANVKITVKDVNDNLPVFIDAPYSGEILENASLGMTVMRVTAVDKDEVKSHWYFLSNLSYWSDFDFVLWWLKKNLSFLYSQWNMISLWVTKWPCSTFDFGFKGFVRVLAVSLRDVSEQDTQLSWWS